MKTTAKRLFAALLCTLMAFCAVTPAFAVGQAAVEPTWQNTIASVTPVGDAPFVKLKLTSEGYKITECRLPRQYDIVFKNGTSVSANIPGEPSHFVPLEVYENYFDVQTPEGTVTLYARVRFASSGSKDMIFSVGQYILQGSLGDDGLPAAGSVAYAFPILEGPCGAEVDEGNVITRIAYFFYSFFRRIENWIAFRFGK